jgi:hypothetical protein
MPKFSFIFAWYDLWIGFFWDREAHWLYWFPLPTVGIVLKFRPKITMYQPYDGTRKNYVDCWKKYDDFLKTTY